MSELQGPDVLLAGSLSLLTLTGTLAFINKIISPVFFEAKCLPWSIQVAYLNQTMTLFIYCVIPVQKFDHL